MNISNNMPAIQVIEKAIETIPGWTPADELLCLYTLVCATTPIGGNILEIGSWCGRSTVVMVSALRASKTGRLTAIDLFPQRSDWFQNSDGTWSFKVDEVSGYTEQTVWNEPFQKDIVPVYQNNNSLLATFKETLTVFGLHDLVDIHKGNLLSWEKKYKNSNVKFRMAFIDGDHSYDGVHKDINIALNHVKPGGVLCFDDAFTVYEGVDKAIMEFVESNERVLFHQQLCRKFHVVFLKGDSNE